MRWARQGKKGGEASVLWAQGLALVGRLVINVEPNEVTGCTSFLASPQPRLSLVSVSSEDHSEDDSLPYFSLASIGSLTLAASRSRSHRT